MAGKFKDIGVRFVSAIIMALICGIPLYFGGIWFLGLALIIGVRIVYEWVRMSDKQAGKIAYIIPMLGVTASILLTYFGAWAVGFSLAITTAIICAVERSRRGGATWAGIGALYMILPSLAMIYVRGGDAGLWKFFFVLLVVIGADVGAYLGGSAIGGPKIAPKLSPKKTWSGFVSGLILGSIVAVVFAKFIGLTPQTAMFLAVPIVIFSVLGDFVESACKRKFEVKDTGGILPGHGGVLDRIDSLMFAMVFFAAFLIIAS